MTVQLLATIDRDCAATTPPGIRVMAPISAWWRHDVELKRSVRLPHPDIEVAVDVGSFTFAQRFDDGFPYGVTADSIVSWCKRFSPLPRWVVLPDWPCENASPVQVADRQQRTLSTSLFMLDHYLDVPWTWVPVVQGWRLDEYARMAAAMADWVYLLREGYLRRGRTDFRVGIGSICRRGQAAEIRRIVQLVAAILPGIPLHLFGVKLDALRDPEPLPETVVSVDTAAWNQRFGSDIPAFNRGMLERQMTQREYAWSIAYPSYRSSFEHAVGRFRAPAILSCAEVKP